MSEEQDSDQGGIYQRFYGDQYSNPNQSEKTSFEKEGINDEELNSPIKGETNKIISLVQNNNILKDYRTTHTKTYKEQRKKNEVNSCLHSITDLLNQIIEIYDPKEEKLQYPNLNNFLETWSLEEIKEMRLYKLFILDALCNKKILESIIKKESDKEKKLFQNLLEFTLVDSLNYFLNDDKVYFDESGGHIYLLDSFQTYQDVYGQKKLMNKKRKRAKKPKRKSS